jgi:hypothetical protein
VKPATEAPINGGRNYDGPKVNLKLALVKLGYMLESLSISHYSPKGSENVMSADNQQERLIDATPSS